MAEMLDSPPAADVPSNSDRLPPPMKMCLDLLQHFGEELKNPSNSLLYKVASWHVLMRMLKWIEKNGPEDWDETETHRDLLDVMSFLGLCLLREAKGSDTVLSKESHGTTEAELNANLAWLRDKRNMCHGDVTPARKAAVLNSLFGDAAAA
jgi:hypothetical protein